MIRHCQAGRFVIAKQDDSSLPSRTSCEHDVLAAPTNWKSVLAKNQPKKSFLLLLPLHQKSHRPENDFIGGHFSRRSCHSRSKVHSSSKIMTFDFIRTFLLRKFHQFFFSGRRKMKCRESSETSFGQVWSRSEPSSRGKRPFKVSRNFDPGIYFSKNFASPKFSRRRNFRVEKKSKFASRWSKR